MSKWAVRGILAVGFLLSVGVVAAAIYMVTVDPSRPERWAVIAGALAVISGLTSAWSANRVAELAEDEKRPRLLPYLLKSSLDDAIDLRVKNFGGGTAIDVRIVWDKDKPLLTPTKRPLTLGSEDGNIDIAVLLPQEIVGRYIGKGSDFFRAFPDTTFRGKIQCRDSSGRSYSDDFLVSAEKYKAGFMHGDESERSFWQKMPDKLDKIESRLESIEKKIGS